MVVNINGCENCPGSFIEGDFYACKFKDIGDIKEESDGMPITPVWCPLKENDINLKLV